VDIAPGVFLPLLQLCALQASLTVGDKFVCAINELQKLISFCKLVVVNFLTCGPLAVNIQAQALRPINFSRVPRVVIGLERLICHRAIKRVQSLCIRFHGVVEDWLCGESVGNSSQYGHPH